MLVKSSAKVQCNWKFGSRMLDIGCLDFWNYGFSELWIFGYSEIELMIVVIGLKRTKKLDCSY